MALQTLLASWTITNIDLIIFIHMYIEHERTMMLSYETGLPALKLPASCILPKEV